METYWTPARRWILFLFNLFIPFVNFYPVENQLRLKDKNAVLKRR